MKTTTTFITNRLRAVLCYQCHVDGFEISLCWTAVIVGTSGASVLMTTHPKRVAACLFYVVSAWLRRGERTASTMLRLSSANRRASASITRANQPKTSPKQPMLMDNLSTLWFTTRATTTMVASINRKIDRKCQSRLVPPAPWKEGAATNRPDSCCINYHPVCKRPTIGHQTGCTFVLGQHTHTHTREREGGRENRYRDNLVFTTLSSPASQLTGWLWPSCYWMLQSLRNDADCIIMRVICSSLVPSSASRSIITYLFLIPNLFSYPFLSIQLSCIGLLLSYQLFTSTKLRALQRREHSAKLLPGQTERTPCSPSAAENSLISYTCTRRWLVFCLLTLYDQRF